MTPGPGRPPAAVAAVRGAVRTALRDLPPGARVLAAVSGGPDSMALADALAFTAPAAGWVAGVVTVDHGLQADSGAWAASVADWARAAGFDPVDVRRVQVTGPGGPEAAARAARYRALRAAAAQAGAVAVLLAHTLDDQAETVLLGLARGSGTRSLAGMPVRRGLFRRPLLGVRRADTAAACVARGLPVRTDPHNADDRYARVRVRRHALPALEVALGPGVADALARTAALLQADADALDTWAAAVDPTGRADWDTAALATLPAAVRTRVLRRGLLAAGVPAGSLGRVHVAAVDALVTRWRGQGPVSLPGGLVAVRRCGRLRVDGDAADRR